MVVQIPPLDEAVTRSPWLQHRQPQQPKWKPSENRNEREPKRRAESKITASSPRGLADFTLLYINHGEETTSPMHTCRLHNGQAANPYFGMVLCCDLTTLWLPHGYISISVLFAGVRSRSMLVRGWCKDWRRQVSASTFVCQ